MPDPTNKISNFWQELKRRKVVRVITVYAAAAFVILELVSIIIEPLRLPEWTLAMVIVLLAIGFIIAVILSWIYDVTPEGIEKTRLSKETKEVVPETRIRILNWKIATYTSLVIIIGLILAHIFRPKVDTMNSELAKSIAVIPFKNFSTDPDQDNICFSLKDDNCYWGLYERTGHKAYDEYKLNLAKSNN